MMIKTMGKSVLSMGDKYCPRQRIKISDVINDVIIANYWTSFRRDKNGGYPESDLKFLVGHKTILKALGKKIKKIIYENFNKKTNRNNRPIAQKLKN